MKVTACAHAVMNSNTGSLECLNCGTSEPVKMPISIPDFCRATEDFTQKHLKCPKPPEGDKK